DYLDTMVNSLNKEHLDLVILGGDYIWIENSSFAKALVRLKQQDIYKNRREAADLIFRSCADCLGQISNKDGIIAVLGNHDRWEAGDAAKDIFQQYNLILGINTSYTVTRKNQNLEFILVDDYWTGFSSVRKFSLNKNKDSSRIIISHNPDFISKTLTEDKFRFDLALCGHTHGGQVKIPGVGPLIKNIRDTRFMEGLVTPEGKACQVYTSRGIGMVEIPLRIDCPPEITIFTLTI
ncbi:MAG: metallophosphoesterase, partial [bacterium]|nr:metallophosphoesterase [bacterium]